MIKINKKMMTIQKNSSNKILKYRIINHLKIKMNNPKYKFKMVFILYYLNKDNVNEDDLNMIEEEIL